MKLSYKILFGTLSTLFLIITVSCQKDEVKVQLDETGIIKVSFNYPDGTLLKDGYIGVSRLPDKYDSTFYVAPKNSDSQPVVFQKLKEGNYRVGVHPGNAPIGISRTGYADTIVTIKANSIDVELLAGIKFFVYSGTEAKRAVSFSQQLSNTPPINTHEGWVYLVDYYLSNFHVGKRYDVVKKVKIVAQVSDHHTSQIKIKVYKIPKEITWDQGKPGSLTYEYFQTLSPAAIHTFTLSGSYSHYYGNPKFEIDPEFFFTAENGIAFLLEGKAVMFFDSPSVTIDYKWEK